MPTLTRKQREIAEREQLILDTARKMFNDGGYLGLSMDRIAEAIEYSKGTIYQHFANKEDLVGALAVKTLTVRADLFARAASFRGRSRERIIAIGVADGILQRNYAEHAGTERLLDIGSILEKTSPQRRETIVQIKWRQMETLLGIVRAGVADGDLVYDEGVPECSALYGLWSMAVGTTSLTSCAVGVPQLEGVDDNAALWLNYQKLLDGYNWRPLSSEWDYAATIERIYAEVFPGDAP